MTHNPSCTTDKLPSLIIEPILKLLKSINKLRSSLMTLWTTQSLSEPLSLFLENSKTSSSDSTIAGAFLFFCSAMLCRFCLILSYTARNFLFVSREYLKRDSAAKREGKIISLVNFLLIYQLPYQCNYLLAAAAVYAHADSYGSTYVGANRVTLGI